MRDSQKLTLYTLILTLSICGGCSGWHTFFFKDHTEAATQKVKNKSKNLNYYLSNWIQQTSKNQSSKHQNNITQCLLQLLQPFQTHFRSTPLQLSQTLTEIGPNSLDPISCTQILIQWYQRYDVTLSNAFTVIPRSTVVQQVRSALTPLYVHESIHWQHHQFHSGSTDKRKHLQTHHLDLLLWVHLPVTSTLNFHHIIKYLLPTSWQGAHIYSVSATQFDDTRVYKKQVYHQPRLQQENTSAQYNRRVYQQKLKTILNQGFLWIKVHRPLGIQSHVRARHHHYTMQNYTQSLVNTFTLYANKQWPTFTWGKPVWTQQDFYLRKEYTWLFHQEKYPQIDMISPFYISMFDTWKSLNQWMWQNFEQTSQSLPRAIRYTDHYKSDTYEFTHQIIDQLHQWMYLNLNYTPVSQFPYQPTSISQILKTRTGDCKDFTLLAKALLKQQGVESFLALTAQPKEGSQVTKKVNQNIPKYLANIPSLGWFNHVILWVPHPKRLTYVKHYVLKHAKQNEQKRQSRQQVFHYSQSHHWLDPTYKKSYPKNLQGQWAWVILDATHGFWIQI